MEALVCKYRGFLFLSFCTENFEFCKKIVFLKN